MFPEQPGLNNSLCSTKLTGCHPMGENVYLSKDKHVSLKYLKNKSDTVKHTAKIMIAYGHQLQVH